MNKINKNKVLEIKNLSLNYHSASSETLAIKDMSFDVYQDEFVTIVGPSGCGKSTFLSVVSGLIKPSSGDVIINSKNKNSQTVGYMFQQDCLFPWKTIKQNVLLGLEIKNIKNEHSVNYALDLIDKYGLTKFLNYYPSQLSGGMRQKAALIRTLALNPDILLLDEPFSALDYQTRINISQEICEIIKKEKKTAVLVTHDISEAVSLSDRVLIFSSRPSKVKKILDINFDNPNLTFHEKRKNEKFNKYFDVIWSELANEEAKNK